MKYVKFLIILIPFVLISCAENLSEKAKKFKLEKFIHLSALGIENALDSKYARSKLHGERRIRENIK